MAVINFYDDFLGEVSYSTEVNDGEILIDVINNYLDSKSNPECKCECYNVETQETTYRTYAPNNYKTLITVNGKEEDTDYSIKKDDVISVVFIPQSSEFDLIYKSYANASAEALWWIFGVTAGVSLLVPGAGTLWALGIGTYLLIDAYKKSRIKDESLLPKNLLSVKGGSNTPILNNKYPVIMGKHLINPMIVGSPYHVTYTSDIVSGIDNGQYYRALYCVGYGPLYLSNFKIGETLLAYNTASTDGERQAILHGLLMLNKDWIEDGVSINDRKYPEYIQKNDNDTFDILKKWKNNDVKLEILQFGNYDYEEKSIEQGKLKESDFIKFRHGIIYPQSVEEKTIDSTALFAYDKTLEDVGSIIYKAVDVPNGFRTNTVRFSKACPTRIQVEIDMPSGMFGTRTYTPKNDSSVTQYEQIPICLAVQWRFATVNQEFPNTESPDGWNTFDYMIFGTPGTDMYDEHFGYADRKLNFDTIEPSEYTAAYRTMELQHNKGLSKDTSDKYNQNWIGAKVFNLSNLNSTFRTLTSDEISKFETDGIISKNYLKNYTWVEHHKEVKTFLGFAWLEDYDIIHTEYWYDIKPGYEDDFKEESVGNDKPHVIKSRLSTSYDKWLSIERYKTDFGREFNVKERRYVFEKNFTEEECRILSGYTESDYTNAVEVRVVRLTPCYIDQPTTTSDEYSVETYQDLVKWSYLRTWTFDREHYLEALKKDSINTSVKDYISRPFSKEDSKLFTYVALEIKQDISETGGNSLEKLSCIAQSFAPNYLDDRANTDASGLGKWYPEKINEVIKYYHKEKKSTGWEINEIPKSEYITGDPNYFWKRSGTDYVEQIKNDVMSMTSMMQDDYSFNTFGLPKYPLTDKVATKYLTSNTASVCLQLMFGAHLKDEAKTWDAVNKNAFAQAYKFYRDVTDGTKQTYKADTQYKYDVDLTTSDRIMSKSDMEASGWNDSTRVENCGFIYTPLANTIYTTFSGSGYKKNSTDFVVATPIVVNESDTYEVITPESLKTIIENGESNNKSVLACFTGSGAEQKGERYAESLHIMQDAYFNNKSKFKNYFDNFKTFPVNAVKRGCYDSQIYDFMDNYNYGTPGYVTYSIKYKITLGLLTFTFCTFSYKSYDIAKRVMNIIRKLFSLIPITEVGVTLSGYSYNGTKAFSSVESSSSNNVYFKLSNINETIDSFDDGAILYTKGNIVTNGYKYLYIKNGDDSITLEKVELGTNDELVGTGIPHIYKDEIIAVLEQMKMFAESDGLMHISFNANGVISKEIKLETLIQNVMLTGRSYITRNDYNEYEPLIGKPNPYPVTVLSQRNCYSKSNARSFDEAPSGYLLTFEDETDNYTSNNIYIMDDGEKWYSPTKKIDNFQLDYVTEKYQAASLARFNLASKIYQRESYARTVGRLGINIALGDTILLQDDSLLVGTDLGGTIQRLIEDDNYIYGFIIDEVYNFTGNNQGVTILQPSKYGKSRCVTLKLKQPEFTVTVNEKKERFEDVYEEDTTYTISKGLTNVVLFNTAVNKSADAIEDAEHQYVIVQPEIGNMVVFGEVNSISEKVVVTGIKPAKDNKFELTLVPYNEDLYNAGDEIPVFTPNMTIPNREPENYAFTDIPSKDIRATDKALILDQVSKSLKEFNSVMVMIYKKSTTEISETGITAKATYTFSTKSIVWDSTGTNNGWVTDYKDIEEDDGDLYISTASAFGSGSTDVIDADDWSVPSVSGKNGINTATITIYKRSSTELKDADLPTAVMTYNYATKEKSWGSTGSSKDWEFTYPNNEDNTPLYVSTATVASSTETDTVESGEWTTPTLLVKDGQDGGYQDYIFTRAPYGTSDEELRKYKWYDAPPSESDDTTPDDYDEVNNETEMCLYMATKWVSK